MTAILPLLEITAIMRNKSGGEHARRLSRAWAGFRRYNGLGLIDGSLFVNLLEVITRKT